MTSDSPREPTPAEREEMRRKQEEQQAREREATRQQMLLANQEVRRQERSQKQLGSSIPIQSPTRGSSSTAAAATAASTGAVSTTSAPAEEEPSMLSFIGSVWQEAAAAWKDILDLDDPATPASPTRVRTRWPSRCANLDAD